MKIVHLLFPLLIVTSQLLSEVGYVKPWGKDSEITTLTSTHYHKKKKPTILAYVALQIILFRQKVLSPVDGPRSHFSPTSSQYMLQAIQDHGCIKGFILGCDRLLRENKEKWIYKTEVCNNGNIYKWDPPPPSSNRRGS